MSEERIQKIQEKLVSTQEFTVQLNKFLDDNFIVEGKTLLEWKKWFVVDIPEQIEFQTIVDLCAEIAHKYQRAAYFRDKQNVQMAILQQSKADKYHSAYQAAQEESRRKFKKNLAAKSCENEATLAVKDLEDAIAHQAVMKNFWTKTCDTLVELRKLLEAMGRALGGDAYVHRDFVVKANAS